MKLQKFNKLIIGIELGYSSINNVDGTIKNVSLAAKKQNIAVHAVNAENIAGEMHLLHGIEQAISSFENKTNFSKSLNFELLIRISGKKQISRALKVLGLKKGKNATAVIAAGKSERKVKETVEKVSKEIGIEKIPINKFLEKNIKDNFKKIQEIYGIKDEAIKAVKEKGIGKEEALENLVIEKNSLVVFER